MQSQNIRPPRDGCQGYAHSPQGMLINGPAENLRNKSLAGMANQDRPPQIPLTPNTSQQLQIVLGRLPESNARIKHASVATNAGRFQSFQPQCQERPHFF